jgi:MazG family protein
MPTPARPVPGEVFDQLVAIMDRLREGCPWDREQTFASLRPFLVEETAEALEALDNADWPHFCEELGDILLQVVFHARLGREAGGFDIVDVVNSINRKMVSRHPHVFGTSEAKTADEVLTQWEALKRAEKPQAEPHALRRLPPALPALQAAQKTSERAAKLGFEWPTEAELFAKLREELGELERAATPETSDEELGDLLLAVVNLARRRNLDAEGALARATAKFRRRFEELTANLAQDGRTLEGLTDPEKRAAWARAKTS